MLLAVDLTPVGAATLNLNPANTACLVHLCLSTCTTLLPLNSLVHSLPPTFLFYNFKNIGESPEFQARSSFLSVNRRTFPEATVLPRRTQRGCPQLAFATICYPAISLSLSLASSFIG
jgi:hypothetical protein